MHRIALVGLLSLAACNVPLVMVEVDAPEVCVTKTVDIDPTTLLVGVGGTDQLPSEMAANLSSALGTTITLDDNLVDLPADAKGLLDLDVQLKLVRVTPLAPHADALDEAARLDITVVPPDGSGLAPATILAFERAVPVTPSGTPIEASGQELNLAEYLYAGQLRFTYAIVADIAVAEAWQAEVTTCVATKGKVAVSANDVKSHL